MRISLAIVGLVCLALSHAQDYSEDFKILRMALEETHPGLYRFESRERVNEVLDSLENSLTGSPDILSFFRVCSRAMSLVHEGHSGVLVSSEMLKQYWNANTFPLEVFVKTDRLIVKSPQPGPYEDLAGIEIIEINDVSIKSLINRWMHQVDWNSGPDNPGALIGTLSLENNFSKAFYFYNDTTSVFDIAYESVGSDRVMYKRLNGKKNSGGFPRMAGEEQIPLEFTIDQKKSLAVIRVKTWAHWVTKYSKNKYKKEFRSYFKKIQEQSIENLVIDVRRNRGGAEDLGADLLRYIADKPFRIYESVETKTLDYGLLENLPDYQEPYLDRKKYKRKNGVFFLSRADFMKEFEPEEKYPFSGRVFVLGDERSWSAASIFLSLVKSHRWATYIGRESGGAYADVDGRARVRFELPYSSIRVSYPVMRMKLKVNPADRRKGVVPDVEIRRSVDDLIHGTDPDMEKVFEIISNQ